MANHTPGPWEVGPNGAYVNVATGSYIHPHEPRLPTPAELEELSDECHDDWRICDCEGSMFDRSSAECAANARLIAAAPELLAALQMLANLGDANIAADIRNALRPFERESFDEAIRAAHEAIAKALGNTPVETAE